MADQQQHGIARGLFEAFQQGVGGIHVHRLGGLEQHDLAPAQLRGLHHEANQVADLVDPDRFLRFLRLQHEVVRMGTGGQQLAGLALAACASGGGRWQSSWAAQCSARARLPIPAGP